MVLEGAYGRGVWKAQAHARANTRQRQHHLNGGKAVSCSYLPLLFAPPPPPAPPPPRLAHPPSPCPPESLTPLLHWVRFCLGWHLHTHTHTRQSPQPSPQACDGQLEGAAHVFGHPQVAQLDHPARRRQEDVVGLL